MCWWRLQDSVRQPPGGHAGLLRLWQGCWACCSSVGPLQVSGGASPGAHCHPALLQTVYLVTVQCQYGVHEVWCHSRGVSAVYIKYEDTVMPIECGDVEVCMKYADTVVCTKCVVCLNCRHVVNTAEHKLHRLPSVAYSV